MRKLLNYWPSAIVFGIVVYATLFPHPLPEHSMPAIKHLDKLIHAVMMGGLSGAIMFDYYRAAPGKNRLGIKPIMLITIAVMGFSVIDEPLQLLCGRSCDPLDLLADCTGCIVAAFTAPPSVRKVVKNCN